MLPRQRSYFPFLIFFAALLTYSCKKFDADKSTPTVVEVKLSDDEQRRAKIYKEIAQVLKYVYQSRDAFYEVNAAIYSEYYDDETVLIKDLLFPETSPLYKEERFLSFKAKKGTFKSRFFEELASGEYPHLKEAMGLNKVVPSLSQIKAKGVSAGVALSAAAPADTALEIYSNSSGASIYFPYSENFVGPFNAQYFDNVNTDPHGVLATIVSVDREAQSAPGEEPYRVLVRYGPNKSDVYWDINYRPVTVNDTYAESKTTHIIGGGADIMCHTGCTPPPVSPTPSITRVFIGYISFGTQQYDNFVSFSKANGGGCEVKLGRVVGYLKQEGTQITSFDGDIITPDKKFKRKDIKHKRYRKLYAVWSSDWKNDDLEQVMVVWEDDNKGEQTITGSLKTTVKRDSNTNVEGTLGYSIKIESQDAIVTHRKFSRLSYFSAAKYDQGCGFEMIDDKNRAFDTDFLPAGYSWPIYECRTQFGWTMPYHVY